MRNGMIPTNRKFAIGSAFALVLVGAVLLGASWHQPVRSQGLQVPLGDGSVRFVAYGVAGLTPGQMLRVNAANTVDPTGAARPICYLRFQLSGLSTDPLFVSERMQLRPGEFRFSGVARRDLNIEGEPGTGRVQVLVKVVIEVPRGSEPEFFPGALEVINEATGETATSTVWEWRKMVQDGD